MVGRKLDNGLYRFKLAPNQVKALRLMIAGNFDIVCSGNNAYIGDCRTHGKLISSFLKLGLVEDTSTGVNRIETFSLTSEGRQASVTGYIDLVEEYNMWDKRKSLSAIKEKISKGLKVKLEKYKTRKERAAEKVETDQWVRASGDTACEVCKRPYRNHYPAPGFDWLTELCNGDLVKL